jgi:hypothetical protein
VPVDGSRFGQTVLQSHLEYVTDLRLDGGTRDLAVEAPRPRHLARRELPIEFVRLEVDTHDFAARLGLRRVVGQGVRLMHIVSIGRRAVSVRVVAHTMSLVGRK